jgi:hypothetical protein
LFAMTDAFDGLFGTGPVVVAAKEAGAGALLADAVSRIEHKPRIVVLVQAPADRYFAKLGIEIIAVRGSGGAWSVDIDDLISSVAPAQIIVGASAGATIEKALIEAGRSRGIPVTAVVDHYWNLWQRFAGVTPGERWRHQPDAIFVPERWCRTRLIELGCPVSDIRVFRHPALEGEPVIRSPELRRSARTRLGWSPCDLGVLFVSEYGYDGQDEWDWEQPPDIDTEGLAAELLTIVSDLTAQGISARLLIRMHPAERRDWNKILLDAPVGVATVDRTLDKAEFLAAADTAFGLNSMLLAEAARSGLPTFSRFPSGTYRGPKLSDFRRTIRELRTRQESAAAIGQLSGRSCQQLSEIRHDASIPG